MYHLLLNHLHQLSYFLPLRSGWRFCRVAAGDDCADGLLFGDGNCLADGFFVEVAENHCADALVVCGEAECLSCDAGVKGFPKCALWRAERSVALVAGAALHISKQHNGARTFQGGEVECEVEYAFRLCKLCAFCGVGHDNVACGLHILPAWRKACGFDDFFEDFARDFPVLESANAAAGFCCLFEFHVCTSGGVFISASLRRLFNNNIRSVSFQRE